jgi:uncharacterized membrane protein YkvA (DUF1232 family)
MMFNKIKKWAKKLKDDLATLYLCYQHPHTPWYAKMSAIITVSYALSPIDLIPDFIPVLGFLDDVILLPTFIWMSLKLIPIEIIKISRLNKEHAFSNGRQKNYMAASVIIFIWLLTIVLLIVGFMDYELGL